jgi:hypothetical protein
MKLTAGGRLMITCPELAILKSISATTYIALFKYFIFFSGTSRLIVWVA